MTDYIINPWFFYILNVVSSLRGVLIAIVSISGFGTVAWIVGNIIMTANESFNIVRTEEDGTQILVREDSDYRSGKEVTRFCKKFIWMFIVFSVLLIVVPPQETILEMMIAKHATYTNAGLALDTIKEACDYVVNAIGNLK